MPLPSPASRQQCGRDTDKGGKCNNRNWHVIDKTMQCVPFCTGRVKDKQMNTVQLG